MRPQFFTLCAGGLGFLRAELAILVSVVFFKKSLMHGFSLGFHRRALGLVELPVAIGVEFLEYFRFALFHLGLHLFAQRRMLLSG